MGDAAEGWHRVVAGPARDDLPAAHRAQVGRGSGMALGVFRSSDVVQGVIGSAKAGLFFTGDSCCLLCF